MSSGLVQLPPEVIYQVLTYLPYSSLVSLIKTCRHLRDQASDDLLWKNIVQENVHKPLTSPGPCHSFKELFASLHPFWFLSRHKIWFSDLPPRGLLILSRYNPYRACIESFRVYANNLRSSFISWSLDTNVPISMFNPNVRLLPESTFFEIDRSLVRARTSRLGPVPAHIGTEGAVISLASTVSPPTIEPLTTACWPPTTIPSTTRIPDTRFARSNLIPTPQSFDQVADAFRIGREPGIIFGTFGTIDEKYYAPTVDKPWQGIWVGDYGGHGCEFVVILQEHVPGDDVPSSSEVAGSQTKTDPKYRGRIKAVKLTGDPNIPRGEISFLSDDIGPNGLVRIAEEEPFRDVRVVKGFGHVAMHGFVNDELIPAHLFLISENRLALYWLDLGHISFFERVDIDVVLGVQDKDENNSDSGVSVN